MLLLSLLSDTVQLQSTDTMLVLNSAADPLVSLAARCLPPGNLTLAEDNIATYAEAARHFSTPPHHVAFHTYILHHAYETSDIAVMNLLYQPGNAWIHYGLLAAYHALRPNGYLYVAGAKDRGIQTIAKRMHELFGNAETLTITKGHRVIRSQKQRLAVSAPIDNKSELNVFARSKLDEGTALLLDALQVQETDQALDLGCGAGHIGLHIARQATKGHVIMVDVSLAAIDASHQAAQASEQFNTEILASNGAEAVSARRFDLVATNPPFHQGGIQTTAIAERFIADAANVLQPAGRFYLVANRFLKYEQTIQRHFQQYDEVGGNSRYKVLRAIRPQ